MAGPPASMEELKADVAEMEKLLALCNDRLKRELKPFLAKSEAQIQALQRAAADEDAAMVLLLGPTSARARALALALATDKAAVDLDPAKQDVFASLETKYYTARLRMRVVDVEIDTVSSASAPSLGDADGLILLWDVQQPSTFTAITSYYVSASPDGSHGERDAVRLCVAVLPDQCDGSEGSDEFVMHAAEWCADNGFEHVCCQLTQAALATARSRWLQQDSRGASLLGEDEDESANRIVEALECHSWPGLQPRTAGAKQRQGPVQSEAQPPQEAEEPAAIEQSKAEETLAKRSEDSPAPAQEEELSVDMMERFTDEIRQVRKMEDPHARQERAMEVAMQMARSWGLEDDDDD
mmetsp:Transcript_50249/g.92840  ORF Transcript_50249/g.92840 Transcript_50249/m.92840 type:complete len:354 (-) Transcript_50249:44-1105(-)